MQDFPFSCFVHPTVAVTLDIPTPLSAAATATNPSTSIKPSRQPPFRVVLGLCLKLVLGISSRKNIDRTAILRKLVKEMRWGKERRTVRRK